MTRQSKAYIFNQINELLEAIGINHKYQYKIFRMLETSEDSDTFGYKIQALINKLNGYSQVDADLINDFSDKQFKTLNRCLYN